MGNQYLSSCSKTDAASSEPGGLESRQTALLTISSREVMIDHADLSLVGEFRWYVRDGYVIRTSDHVRLHRVLLDAKPGQIVDHANGNTLDNRRANLRLCTQQQNLWNRRKFTPRKGGAAPSSPYRGVYFSKHPAHAKKPWLAYISVNKKRTFVGAFTDELAAAKAYDRVALETRGEFARLNFPDGAA